MQADSKQLGDLRAWSAPGGPPSGADASSTLPEQAVAVPAAGTPIEGRPDGWCPLCNRTYARPASACPEHHVALRELPQLSCLWLG